MSGGYRFFLGGTDLEMAAIRELLASHTPGRTVDRGLAWGASASAYREEIEAALARGETPVLVELADDLPAEGFERARLLWLDHHGPRAGLDRPSALEQVFELLSLDPARHWTRRHALIAANDKGHIRALLAMGASAAEIRAIRAEDRRAQGVTLADEAEARVAIAARRTKGRLTLVELPSRRAGVVADLLEPLLGGPGADQLLVRMPGELAFYGDWPIVEALNGLGLAESWSGGARPLYGFWGGHPSSPEEARRIDALIRERTA